MVIDALSMKIKTINDYNDFKRKVAEERMAQRREDEENCRRQEEKRRESMVQVRFSADFYFTDYAGRHDRSNSWNCELTKDEYNALLSGGTSSIANYIRSNLLDIRVFPKDSVITRATMAKC
jgi:hypothetical protein